MRINWKIRMKQKVFWLALFSALVLFASNVAKTLGYDIEVYTRGLTDVVNSVLGFLVTLGVIQDPTTNGLNDSYQALEYDEPRREY
ncbi:TPA: phage holin [Staphylococcus aureus]|uniref:phage holin n=1 Tax=Staphylococcus aureus TaxID=1280 RepID=UPI00077BCA50|nr:phage holin [Staphylococcus aureus]UFA54889.1 phage holin [Staphylococcus aureus]CZQ66808.1 Phage holin [Staphylococcus aureus]HDD0209283.1 phage holin [Staphylococcus aureus]HDD0303929.1 phage holin [Staphylococcus aureus]HDD0308545.1 phage holin [Staphylococcus aureus]